MRVLVDTNVLSELARPAPDQQVVNWASSLATVAVSVVTVEEVSFGLAAKPNPRISAWFEGFFARYCDVLEVSEAIARQAGLLRAGHAARGRARTQADMLIAATAAHHGLTLATRNERDFRDCGVAVVNPFHRPARHR